MDLSCAAEVMDTPEKAHGQSIFLKTKSSTISKSPFQVQCNCDSYFGHASGAELKHPSIDLEIDISASSNGSEVVYEEEDTPERNLRDSIQDIAFHQTVQEDIKVAGMSYEILLTMPDDIQSIFHRTALRRQMSRQVSLQEAADAAIFEVQKDLSVVVPNITNDKIEADYQFSPTTKPPPYASVSPLFLSEKKTFRPQDSVQSMHSSPRKVKLLKFPEDSEKLFTHIPSPTKADTYCQFWDTDHDIDLDWNGNAPSTTTEIFLQKPAKQVEKRRTKWANFFCLSA